MGQLQERLDMPSSQTGQTTSQSAEIRSRKSTARQEAPENAQMRRDSWRDAVLAELGSSSKIITLKRVRKEYYSVVAERLRARQTPLSDETTSSNPSDGCKDNPTS